MYELKEETKNNINNIIQKEFGMAYEEFNELDFDEQQKIIKTHRKKNINNKIPVMIGSGEHSTFIHVEKGDRVMLDDGTFVIAGMTIKEEKQELDNGFNTSIATKIKRKILKPFKKI